MEITDIILASGPCQYTINLALDCQKYFLDTWSEVSVSKEKLPSYARVCMLSRSVVSDSAASWIVACQAPLVHGTFQARVSVWVAISSSREASEQEIKPESRASPALAGRFFTI